MAKLFSEILLPGGSGDVVLLLEEDPHCAQEDVVSLRCHSLILTQHPYFCKMLNSASAEGITREIHISEPRDEFMELLRFVYTNQLDIDRANVVGLLTLADKYCIDDVLDLCLKYIKEHFDADMFFQFCTFTSLNSAYFEKLKEQLMSALHQRRNMCLIAEDERWQELPVALVEAILSQDDLPITSEAEVLTLIVQWLGPHRCSARDVARLLGAFRKCESTLVRVSDVQALVESVELDIFSSKEPRHGSAVWDPSFAVHRHEAALTASVPIGAAPDAEINSEGTLLQLGPKDALQQEPGWVHPGVHRCQVALSCSSWAHRERRLLRGSPKLQSRSFDCSPAPSGERQGRMPGHERSPSPPPGFQVRMPPFAWEALGTFDIANMADGSEQGGLGPVIRNLPQDKVDNELVFHHIICGVFSGVQRHGVRLSQRERNAIFTVEDLNGQQSLQIGGTMSSVSFDLELTIGTTSRCGISRCRFALLRKSHVLMEEWFDVSVKVPLRFYFTSSYLDKNSTYSVDVKWRRPGEEPPQRAAAQRLQPSGARASAEGQRQELQRQRVPDRVPHHYIGH
mmetsp:Transcript_109166/g.305219  ORF Transcript_109166/g.305219 Transcript_109166/m.305219 type:complete len:569 (-) Transcript_109166:82-1788(-)